MSVSIYNAVSVRFGQIVNNDTGEVGPHWAKLGVLLDSETRPGFSGQQFAEIPIDPEQAQVLPAQLTGKLPAELKVKTGMKVLTGKAPTIVVRGLA